MRGLEKSPPVETRKKPVSPTGEEKKGLTPGTRVICYGNTRAGAFDPAPQTGMRGEVVSVDQENPGYVVVELDSQARVSFHEKQCRRLRRRERKRLWLVRAPKRASLVFQTENAARRELQKARLLGAEAEIVVYEEAKSGKEGV